MSHRAAEDAVHRNDPAPVFDPGATVEGLSSLSTTSTVNTSSPSRFVMGFHPYWIGTAWQSYRWSTISTLAWFKQEVNWNGTLINNPSYEPDPALISTAHANGVSVVLTVTATPNGNGQPGLLKDPGYFDEAVSAIIAKVQATGMDGVNVDFELIPASDRAGYTLFVQMLGTALRAAIPTTQYSVDIPAIDWNESYDEVALAAASDFLMLMAYDYWWPGSTTAGPVAPLYDTSWRSSYSVRSSLDTLLTQVDRSKVVMGVPWYGIKYKTDSTNVPANATSYVTHPRYSDAADEAATFGRTWYPTSLVPYVVNSSGATYQTWYDDYDSLNAKYSLAANEGLRGVGVWALGYDGGRPELWDALQTFGAPNPDSLTRLSGSDRYATANAISHDSFPVDDGAQCAVLATGTNWPDALGGSVLARACNGPLLLTTPDDLLGSTADELARVLPAGGLVHLLGGTAALSQEVADDLSGLGFNAQRVAGSNRVETATTVADTINNGPTSVVIGTKNNFPDVLSLASPAAERLFPVLLTASDKLSDATRNFLQGPRAANVTTIYVAGGESAVSPAVTDELASLNFTVIRIAGDDRYATSAAVAAQFAPNPTQVALATGTSFPDGLTGAANAAGLKAPVLLVQPGTLPQSVWSYIEQHASSIVGGRVYGGFSAVSRAVQDVGQTLIAP